MIASLPMYDRPYTRAAHDALWDLIRDGLRANGIDAPETLDRDTDHLAGWARADLVLGQICNLPYRAKFRDKVTVIGAADYDLPDCPPGHYNSVFVVHKDATGRTPQDFATSRFAANALMARRWRGLPRTVSALPRRSSPAHMTARFRWSLTGTPTLPRLMRKHGVCLPKTLRPPASCACLAQPRARRA